MKRDWSRKNWKEKGKLRENVRIEKLKKGQLKKGAIEKNLENRPKRSSKSVNRNLNFDAVPPLKFPKKPEELSHDDDYPCLVCGSSVSSSKECWWQCNMCLKWAHGACSEYDCIGFYVCDFCIDTNK